MAKTLNEILIDVQLENIRHEARLKQIERQDFYMRWIAVLIFPVTILICLLVK